MDKKPRNLVMGKLYLMNKDYKAAEKSLIDHLEESPLDYEACKMLGSVYEKTNRYDKAFELYERCYLTEPDRTAIILDICRLLTMDSVFIEQADYRKWYDLASRTFPSNCIVDDLKAKVSTSIPEYNPRMPQLKTLTNNKSVGDDYIKKRLGEIFDKLATIEQGMNKFSDLEKKIDGLEKAIAKVKISQSETPRPSAEKPVAKASVEKAAVEKATAERAAVEKAAAERAAAERAAAERAAAEKAAAEKAALNQPSVNKPPTFGSAFASPFSATSQPNEAATPAPAATFGSAFGSAFSSPFGSMFGNTAAQTNLFANSLSKFNLPVEGSWTQNPPPPITPVFQKKDDEEDEGDDGGDNAENEELPIENTCDMKPIEIKTGEEDEDILFTHRAKLYRFRDKEFKERGLGDIKALKNRLTGKGRLIMRRDVIGLVCLNCWDCKNVERVKENQIRFAGTDASDGEPEPSIFIIKFKTADKTDEFLSHMDSLFGDETSFVNSSTTSTAADANASQVSSHEKTPDQPDVQLIAPQLDPTLVDKARKLQLPDLFYHRLPNQMPCKGCRGCEQDA